MDRSPTKEEIEQALRSVIDPELGKDIVSLGMVRDIHIGDGDVEITLVLTTAACPLRSQLQAAARQAVLAVPSVRNADVVLAARDQSRSERQGQGIDERASADNPTAIPGVRYTIAIASGKGGVGKSTVSSNLAVALSKKGCRVGLLDADITGPNIPLMMGVTASSVSYNGLLTPPISYGVKVMSIGFFTDRDTPVIWRGSLISRAIQQFLYQVEWGELDFLVVDLPPGTGDVPLTLARSIPLSGAVIITTPQDVALLDARKALVMFRKLNVPILGIIENMSYYVCRHCGERADIFGTGGGEKASQELAVPFLGRIPLDHRIRQSADAGTPVVLSLDIEYSDIFFAIAQSIINGVESYCDTCRK